MAKRNEDNQYKLDPIQHPSYLVVQDGCDYLVGINRTTGESHWRNDIDAAIEYVDCQLERECLQRIHGPNVKIVRQTR